MIPACWHSLAGSKSAARIHSSGLVLKSSRDQRKRRPPTPNMEDLEESMLRCEAQGPELDFANRECQHVIPNTAVPVPRTCDRDGYRGTAEARRAAQVVAAPTS